MPDTRADPDIALHKRPSAPDRKTTSGWQFAGGNIRDLLQPRLNTGALAIALVIAFSVSAFALSLSVRE